ncbi:MAG: PAS domain-containing protein [Thermoflexales bacterium]|nr:PAS domain-containing protein [Thermoflexales bacterium]
MTPKPLNNQLAGLFSDLADLSQAVQDSPPEPKDEINEFQRLMERVPIGVCRVSLAPDGKFELVNPAFRQMFGLETDEALAAFTLLDLFSAEDALKTFINDLIVDSRSTTLQLRLRKRDGTTRLCAINAACDGSLQFADCTIEDVTERKQAEEQTELWNLRYELALAHSRQLIYDGDTQNGLILWGGGIEEVLGYTSAQMHGGLTQWADRVHPEDRGHLLGVLDIAEGNLASYETTYRFRRKDGDYLTMLDRGFFIADETGRAARRVGLMQDVTPKAPVTSDAAVTIGKDGLSE